MEVAKESNLTKRVNSPGAEKWLYNPIQCLNKGFVTLVNYMGNDHSIVEAARVSYLAKGKTEKDDIILTDYLMRHKHTSPFEHVVTEWHCKMPIFVARQWIRHRTARINEVSGRYTEMPEEFYVPAPDDINLQSKDNKQGRSKEEVPQELRSKVLEIIKKDQGSAYANYKQLLNDGIAKELARINLPLSLYTQWYWQMDLHNLFHFLAPRLDSHAQKEIQVYGEAIAKVVKEAWPIAFNAFENYSLEETRLSKRDKIALKQAIKGRSLDEIEADKVLFLSKLEAKESIEKITSILKL